MVSALLGFTQWLTAEGGLQVSRTQFPHPWGYSLLPSQPLPWAQVQGRQAHMAMCYPPHTSSLLGNMHPASVLSVITGGAGPDRRNGVFQKVICLTHCARGSSCLVSELSVVLASEPSHVIISSLLLSYEPEGSRSTHLFPVPPGHLQLCG